MRAEGEGAAPHSEGLGGSRAFSGCLVGPFRLAGWSFQLDAADFCLTHTPRRHSTPHMQRLTRLPPGAPRPPASPWARVPPSQALRCPLPVAAAQHTLATSGSQPTCQAGNHVEKAAVAGGKHRHSSAHRPFSSRQPPPQEEQSARPRVPRTVPAVVEDSCGALLPPALKSVHLSALPQGRVSTRCCHFHD